MLTTLAYACATLAMVLIAAGLVMARNRKRHVPLMLSAFAVDMVGLVIVEFGPLFTDEKTDPVTGLVSEPGLMKSIHAALATAAIVGYVLQILSGKKVMAGDRSSLVTHKKVARLFIVMRLAAYITMFML